MKILVILLVFFLISYQSLRTVHACTNDDPESCFSFDDGDSVIPDSTSVSRLFSFPPVKAGFIIDLYNPDVTPHMSVELLTHTAPWDSDIAYDFGVANSRLFLNVTWELVPIVKIGPSVWAGWNVGENEPSFGVGFSILDF